MARIEDVELAGWSGGTHRPPAIGQSQDQIDQASAVVAEVRLIGHAAYRLESGIIRHAKDCLASIGVGRTGAPSDFPRYATLARVARPALSGCC